MSTAYVRDTQFFTRRTVVLAAIIALHVFIFWALATGLADRAVQLVAPPIQTQIVRQHHKHVKPPPPPPPQLRQTHVRVPPPVIQINVPAAAQSHAITVTKHVVRAPPRPPAPVHYTNPSEKTGFPRASQYYPEAARQLGESGTAIVRVCISPSGGLAGEPTIAKSSGVPRLDRAALRLVRAAGRGHYFVPAKRNGVPYKVCLPLPVKFQLSTF